MLPVPPNVAPTISLELDVDDGEVENYEVRQIAMFFDRENSFVYTYTYVP